MAITLERTWKVDGVLTNADAVTLAVVRTDTGSVIVVAGTPMTNMGAGVYQYTFDEPAPSLTYSIVETVTFQDQPVVFQFTQRGNSNVEIGTGPVPVCHYGDVTDADAYFANRLHACAWTDADPADQPKALWAATQIIDTLNFKGVRHSLWTLLQEYPDRCFPFGPHPTGAQLRQAEQEQPLEFPARQRHHGPHTHRAGVLRNRLLAPGRQGPGAGAGGSWHRAARLWDSADDV